MKPALAAALATVVALALTGCTPYTGMNSLPLPGTEGTGPHSYEITVKLGNADGLVANTPVFYRDVNIGTTTLVTLVGYTPTLTLSIKDEVKLPANATATLAQTSLLGSKHIEIGLPAGARAAGALTPGAVIGEDRSKAYPETEDVLAGVSLLLNGGGLQHVQTITTELNRALGNGRAENARALLTKLGDFTAGIDRQTEDITAALHDFDHLGAALAPRMADIDEGLQRIPLGLDTLSDIEPHLITTLSKLGHSSSAIAPFADAGTDQLGHVLDDMKTPLRALGAVQPGSWPRALRQLPLVIFTPDSLPYAARGDYANLGVTINLTLDSLDKTLLTGTPASGSAYSVAQAMRDFRVPGANTVPPPTNTLERATPYPAPPLPGPPLVDRSSAGSLPPLPKLGR